MLNIRHKLYECRTELTLAQIRSYYLSHCKEKKDFKIGLEYEQISFDTKTRQSAHWAKPQNIVCDFAKAKKWELIKDADVVIGAKKGGSSISLEPGGQFEISLEPKKSVYEIEICIKEILETLKNIAKTYDVKFLPYGISPSTVYQNTALLKKQRYIIMARYLPSQGAFAPVMMRETAGVQVNFDYSDEIDALYKLKVCALMSPFMTGFYANSPIRNNKLTNYKSFRALAWKYMDSQRSGLFYKNLLKSRLGLGFDDYINAILDVPMLFIERGERKILINGKITFKQFLKHGYMEEHAEFKDYLLHAGLCFPDIRLKNCLEIRNHDSQNLVFTMSICALYNGILKSKDALDEVYDLLSLLSHSDLEIAGTLAAQYGLNFQLPCEKLKLTPAEIVRKLFDISYCHIDDYDKKYLACAYELIYKKNCVADLILKRNIKNTTQLLNYLEE